MKKFDIILPCAIGIEKLLSHEIEKLGGEGIEKVPGRVSLTVSEELMYRILRQTRLAERVFVEVCKFKASNFDEYYQGIRSARWHDFLPAQSKVRVDKVRVHQTTLSAITTLQSMAMKALADALNHAHKGKGLSHTGFEHTIRIYGDNDYFRIVLDLSGEALHKRSYRLKAGRAPLKETISASLLHFNVWRRKTALHDPFCGSGTICLEALLYAANIAPNLHRSMALENMALYQSSLDLKVKAELGKDARFDTLVRIRGTDSEPAMIKIAKDNLEALKVTYKLSEEAIAWVDRSIEFSQGRMEEQESWAEDGLLLFNPPYGERLVPDEGVEALYGNIGELKSRFGGWIVSFISSIEMSKDLVKFEMSQVKKVQNGSSDAYVFISKKDA